MSLAIITIVFYGLHGISRVSDVIHAESQEISKSARSIKCYLFLQKRNPLKYRRDQTMAKKQKSLLVMHIYSGV